MEGEKGGEKREKKKREWATTLLFAGLDD